MRPGPDANGDSNSGAHADGHSMFVVPFANASLRRS